MLSIPGFVAGTPATKMNGYQQVLQDQVNLIEVACS